MKYFKIFLLFLLSTTFCNAQVGINTSTPDASSVLDVQFKAGNPKGMLTPRMTTSQRGQIASPANGLLVFDTDLKTFYYYDSSSATWIQINGNANGRSNFKLIKSTDNLAIVLASELAAGGGSKYVLNTNTLYEINGLVILNFPIDLNNAYVQGLDSGDDKIVSVGNIFDGSKGGTVKGLTLVSSGKVFNLSGAQTENLIFRDCIVANSASVGSISGFGLVFFSIVQFSGNITGITYTNINQLLLNNLGWFGNNLGTYETMTGTFKLVQKQGGFSEVNGTAVGLDVSANPAITGDAVMESVVFTGTNTVGYIKPYTTGTYTGYNFNNSWNVTCAGIPNETDATATGSFYVDYAVGSGFPVNFNNNTNPSNIVKVAANFNNTATSNLFRFSSDSVNKLIYLGKRKRIFQVAGSISFQVPGAATYIIYIAKNGSSLTQYKIYGRGQVSGDIIVLPINGAIELSDNDYLEIYVQRYTGVNGDIIVPNMTITIR